MYNMLDFIKAQAVATKKAGRIKIYCRSAGTSAENSELTATHNLAKSIKLIRASCTSSVYFTHVYGHQDRTTPSYKLSRQTQMNITVNKLTEFIMPSTLRITSNPPQIYHFLDGTANGISNISAITSTITSTTTTQWNTREMDHRIKNNRTVVII